MCVHKSAVHFSTAFSEEDACYGRVTLAQALPDCRLVCMNGGTLDDKTCSCSCTPLFEGVECQFCPPDQECLNGGTFDEEDCVCVCPSGYTGVRCEGLEIGFNQRRYSVEEGSPVYVCVSILSGSIDGDVYLVVYSDDKYGSGYATRKYVQPPYHLKLCFNPLNACFCNLVLTQSIITNGLTYTWKTKH